MEPGGKQAEAASDRNLLRFAIGTFGFAVEIPDPRMAIPASCVRIIPFFRLEESFQVFLHFVVVYGFAVKALLEQFVPFLVVALTLVSQDDPFSEKP
jgi:hypothetical protein